MSDEPRYRVFPGKVDHKPVPQVASMPLNDWEKKHIEEQIEGLKSLAQWLIGIAAYGVCILPFQFLADVAGIRSHWGDVLGFVAAVLVAVLVVSRIDSAIRGKKIAAKIAEEEQAKARRAKESIDSSNKSTVSLAESEAQMLTHSLTRTYESASTLTNRLPQHVTTATARLKHAEKEFGDNAFGPFWDAVENRSQAFSCVRR